MVKLLAPLAAVAAALALSAPATAFSKQDVTLPMDDGVALAATLYLPSGAPPAAGWPAIAFLHGLAGTRQDVATVAERYGFVGERYAVLAFDARGHGASGGLVSIDGPREIADTRAVYRWLRARPDVADGRIGAWGISYGGGAIWNSLAAGVPWAAVEVVETWTDLYDALVPQGLVKTGLVAGLASSIPEERKTPGLKAIQASAFAGTGGDALAAWARERSSLSRLKGVKTPVFMMQGRRDFLFPIDQATRAFAVLQGPKRLWLGNHGHAPSTFPAADTAAMLREGRLWFDRFLRSERNGIDAKPPIVLASEGAATVRRLRALPRVRTTQTAFTAGRTITATGKIVLRSAAQPARSEVLGSPTVRVTATARAGWSRLVAVLVARTPIGTRIVVSAGGVPTTAGTRAYTIRLADQATVVPRGSRYELTLAASSTAQDPSNLLYLDLPMPAGARLAVGRVDLRVPVLR